MPARIHPSSVVAEMAEIGEGTQIWLFCQVRENVRIGPGCILGKGVYVDTGVTIGRNVKIQNNVSIFAGVTIEDGVFVGPHVCFTNDKVPRAVNADMTAKGADDWEITNTLVKAGAALDDVVGLHERARDGLLHEQMFAHVDERVRDLEVRRRRRGDDRGFELDLREL